MSEEKDKEEVLRKVHLLIQEAADSCEDELVAEHIREWDVVTGYAEPGCDPVDAVVVGNFNMPYRRNEEEVPLPPGEKTLIAKLCAELKSLGKVECEWRDEWLSCSECNLLVRTSPDCYFWTPHFVILHGADLYCLDCIKKDESLIEEVIDAHKNRSKKAISKNWGFDLSKYGFVQVDVEPFETGLHEHQDDDPKVVLQYLRKLGYDVLFMITCVQQFDSNWVVWVSRKEGSISPEELKQLQEGLSDRKNVVGFSPSEAAKKLLRGG
jgi:hypothetical protein